jgi:hypothetical protein
MIMSDFTKGPWKYDEKLKRVVGSGQGIADMHFGSSAYLSEMSANAHLISACPDMYEQLDEARKDLFILAGNIRDAMKRCGGDRWQGVPEVIDARLVEVRKALARAEGKEVAK